MDSANKVTEYVTGDLVTFVGYYYSPDYMYTENDDNQLGIVVGRESRLVSDYLYRVYWFKNGNITVTVAGHLKLVRARKNAD